MISHREKEKVLHNTWMRFNGNVGSLYVFFEKINNTADLYDREKVRQLAADMAGVFDDDVATIEEELLDYLPSFDNLEVLPDFRENASVKAMLEIFVDSDFKKHLVAWQNEHPIKAQKLVNILLSAFDEPPMSGQILRRSILVTLVGFLELLFQELFFDYFYLSVGKDALDPINRHAAFNADSRKDWAIKKAESFMGGGWRKRTEKFQRIGIPFEDIQRYMDHLMEITQRRNLLVHNDGILDDDYLKRIPEKYRNEEDWKPGRQILITPQYLRQAFDVVHAVGLVLQQLCWRQWTSGNYKLPNQTLSNFIVSALKHNRYEFVRELTTILDFRLPRTVSQAIKVDHAIALRELGDTESLHSVVSELANSKPSWKIQIAISMLKKDYVSLQMLLSRAATQNKLKLISADWPLFKPIKDESWFIKMFVSLDKGDLPTK